ncbi:uncharacterized protein TNCV_2919821 [Trichonephila clavipes]|nr:uncharacterized protein TNCV_2919821 [Trichonephila clavipes]
MPLSRMENTTFAMPSIIDSHDMGLRTVYSPDAQKKTPIQPIQPILAAYYIFIFIQNIINRWFNGLKVSYKENETWRRRSNLELYRSCKESDIVNFIKIQRIKWAGHVVRMEEDPTTKNARPTGTRRKGRLNLRWIDGLEKDLLVLKARNWRRLAWKRLFEKAKAHPGLSSH